MRNVQTSAIFVAIATFFLAAEASEFIGQSKAFQEAVITRSPALDKAISLSSPFVNEALYDFSGLALRENGNNGTGSYNSTVDDWALKFDVCENIREQDQCQDTKKATYATATQSNGTSGGNGTCKSLTSASKWKDFTYKALDDTDQKAGVMLNFTGGDSTETANGTKAYAFTLILRCKDGEEAPEDDTLKILSTTMETSDEKITFVIDTES